MPKRSSMQDGSDHLAKKITDLATGNPITENPAVKAKNPAAVALGRIGGLKGGKARAEKLTSKKRQAIARKAAKARWSKKEESQ
jgi:hypothetical protein